MGKVLEKYEEVLHRLERMGKNTPAGQVDGGWASSLSMHEGWGGEPEWWAVVMANILFL